MRKLVLIAPAVVLFALSFQAAPVSAQEGAPTLAEIQRMVDSATMIDPEIERYLPRWRVQEADLKIKIAQYFKLEGIPVRETDSMIVTATFPKPETGEQELLSIRVGPKAVISGGQNMRLSLGEGLYQQILGRNYAHQIIPPATPLTEGTASRIGNVMRPANARQFVAASAFRQVVQLGTTGARLEHMLGNDEIGYHFWASGQGKAVVQYPVIRLDEPERRSKGVPDILTVSLGAAYRVKFGTPQENVLGGVIAPRRLNGSLGTKAVAQIDYRLPQVNDIGFSIFTEIPFARLEPQTANMSDGGIVTVVEPNFATITPRDSVEVGYFLRTVAQGSIFWETWLNDYEHYFRIGLGASYQEFARGVVAYTDLPPGAEPGTEGVLRERVISVNDNEARTGIIYRDLIHPSELEDWIFAKVEYLNQSGFPFGLSAQLANRNLLVGGFIPVIPNWLFIEAKYSTPILRDEPAPWENRSFFMISPIIRFQID